MEFYANNETRLLAEKLALNQSEVLRLYSLKMKEKDYMHRVLTQLNQQASPFKDDHTKDSIFTREMLDIYRDAEAV